MAEDSRQHHTRLSVNLNKIALLRNSREGDNPSVVRAARMVLDAGADGITVHPRPDQRHIRPGDVTDLTALLRGYPDIEFNIEGNPFAGPRPHPRLPDYPGFSALIEAARPAQATLVPDTDEQLTSDHGWDLTGDSAALAELIGQYQRWGARVSLFMDPVLEQIDRAKALGADRIELYTGPFCAVVARVGVDHPDSAAALAPFQQAASHAAAIGLGVNAGHDLDLVNLQLFRRIDDIAEVSIGHALVGDALEQGLHATVQAYLALLR